MDRMDHHHLKEELEEEPAAWDRHHRHHQGSTRQQDTTQTQWTIVHAATMALERIPLMENPMGQGARLAIGMLKMAMAQQALYPNFLDASRLHSTPERGVGTMSHIRPG